MMVFLFNQILIGLCLISSVISNDLFHEHFKKYINQSINPCDNFYRHVCPLNFDNRDSIMDNFLPPSVQRSLQAQINKTGKLEKAYQMADFNLLFIKTLSNPLAGIITSGLRNYIYGIKFSGPFLDYISKNNLLTPEFYDQMSSRMDLMMGIQREQFQKTNTAQLDNEFEQHFERLVETMKINIGSLNEGTNQANYTKIYELLGDLYESLGESGAEDGEAGEEVMELIIWLGSIDFEEFTKTALLPDGVNAFNAPAINALTILEGALLLAKGIPPAVFWGSTGFVFGHEIQHSFFRDAPFEPHLKIGKKCLQKFKKEICDEFGDDDPKVQLGCNSLGKYCPCRESVEADTYVEDVADWEGFQLAYLSMVRDIGEENLQKKPYPDLPITNRQLFYYSYAAFWCKGSPYQNYEKGSKHSGLWMRAMMPSGLSQHFQEVFQCDEKSQMARVHKRALNQCNQYGEAAKFAHSGAKYIPKCQ